MNYGKTTVIVCDDEHDLGWKAAVDVARTMRELLAQRDEVKIVFAAGESQMTFLDALALEKDVAWDRVVCFNMDEFHDVRMPAEYTCAHQCRTQLYDKVKPARIHLLNHNAPDAEKEAERFEAVVRQEAPIDILCQGIGTSGHLAFNEPHTTDFDDPKWVRVMQLDGQSKKQLMDDPNFKSLGYIPAQGITMTLRALLSAPHVFTMVPLALKRPILTRLFGLTEPTVELPASILLNVEGKLYVDRNSRPAV